MSHRRGGPLRLRAFLYRHVWGATLLFPENVLAAPWYSERLQAKQKQEIALWSRHIDYLKKFCAKTSHADEASRLRISERLDQAKNTIDSVKLPAYLKRLEGSIGLQPLQALR